VQIPQEPIGESDVEKERLKTIAILNEAPSDWPANLLDAVREHVARDRRYTTEIADFRKEFFQHEQRPDLNEPLVEESHKHPHALTE
jgi:hypothetical protein